MRYCPRCYLTDDELGTCANFALGCPEPVEVEDPSLVAHIQCGPCDKRVAVPIANLMRGRLMGLPTCSTDRCPAKLILPQAASPASNPTPAPIADAETTKAANARPAGGANQRPGRKA